MGYYNQFVEKGINSNRMKLDRRRIRGSNLLPMCRKARIDKQEICGIYYCYCYGKHDASNGEILDKCKKCKAWNQYDSLAIARIRQRVMIEWLERRK